ncbi:hypothetical protein [Salmon gill poxvirus]|uniref:Uncharacterized protein n=1 Tax=Salmon gill poxvirus TaxID=1680908 RepID=A0A0H4XWI1_9POXV|nr:hypothetical protein AL387_gp079 [Salmon gill poxvirus]AKR04203.1 hypothetical protein SGPV079 [Salmon gill poxvirus]
MSETTFVVNNIFIYSEDKQIDRLITSKPNTDLSFISKIVSFLSGFIDVNESCIDICISTNNYVKKFKIQNGCILESNGLGTLDKVIQHISDINLTCKTMKKYKGIIITNPKGRNIIKMNEGFKLYLQCPD